MTSPPLPPTTIQLPQVNKAFVRGLFWLAVFLFLASIFSSFRLVYDNLLKKPEVRREIIEIGSQVSDDNMVWAQRAAVVQNRGNADARNVYIQLSVPNGKLTRVEPYSDEPFHEIQPVLSDSRAFTLTRLASGAKIMFLTWSASVSSTLGTTSTVNTPPVLFPIVSVAFDGGIAEESERLTALEEMQNLGRMLLDGLNSIWNRLGQKLNLQIFGDYLVGMVLPQFGISYMAVPEAKNSEVSSALIAVGMLIGFAWLLLKRVWAGLVTAIFSGTFLWLYFDPRVHVYWLLIPFLLSIVAISTTRSKIEVFLLLGVLLGSLAWLIVSLMPGGWACIVDAINAFTLEPIPFCSQAYLDGGPVIGMSVLAAYLLFVEL